MTEKEIEDFTYDMVKGTVDQFHDFIKYTFGEINTNEGLVLMRKFLTSIYATLTINFAASCVKKENKFHFLYRELSSFFGRQIDMIQEEIVSPTPSQKQFNKTTKH